MSRQRNHSIIAIFSVLTMQSECLSFDMDITDSEIGHLSRADEEVVDDLTCKEIVPVVLHQIISGELHGAVRYDISAFLLPVLDTFQTFCWVLGYIASSQQISGETLSPGKIVVACQDCIIAVDENVVQELANINSVKLVGVVERYSFLLLPFSKILRRLL